MAEEVGFEPTVLSYNGFQDRRLKPLGHSSVDFSRCCSPEQRFYVYQIVGLISSLIYIVGGLLKPDKKF
jgi:hypothetical protein